MLVGLLLLGLGMPPGAAHGQTPTPVPGQCGVLPMPGGSFGLFCVPASGWNGDLVVWAHGYRRVTESLAFQDLELPDGTNLATLAQSLGYAFVATTYRQNGLTVLEGLDDIRELVVTFRILTGRAPRYTYMAGASEGGLVTTLLLERSPELFSGGLALCGPTGDFRKELEYVGDFRVLFDYFFPGVLPGNALRIPDELIRDWDRVYVPRIEAAVAANPWAALQVISTSKAAIDPRDGASILETFRNLLAYSTFSTNDAVAKLRGNPFGNIFRLYTGSFDDLRLNQSILRVGADPLTLLTVAPYQTSGQLTRPLVTIHTTGDEIVPFWHQVLYQLKARPTGRGRLTPIAIDRYGHCNFTGLEAVVAFGLLVEQVTGAQPAGVAQRLDAGQVKRDYERARQDATPKIPRDSR
jgi:pimeloyl-ACP methyl ester carboxylesterase